jgi:hypothetical protein
MLDYQMVILAMNYFDPRPIVNRTCLNVWSIITLVPF